MRILITGVSGYAGYHAAMRLAAAGHEVSGLVRNPSRARLDLLRMHEVTLCDGDIRDPDGFREELERSDVVIHTMLDKGQPRETDRGLFRVLASMPKRSGAPRRFIYTTGCSIFGKVDVPVMDESTEPNPAHPLAFRRELEREALALDLGTVVLRPGFMYGKDGHNSVSTDWFEMAESGDPVFRGDRERAWSWIHIDDLAQAYLLAAEAGREVDGELFCLADDQRPRCVDVMRACLAAAGYTGELRFEGPKAGDNISTWFNQNELMTSAKARRVLGWIPRHPSVFDGIPAAYTAWTIARRLYADTPSSREHTRAAVKAGGNSSA